MDLFSQPEFQIHHRENNAVSEGYLNANKKRLSRNCKTLFEVLMFGARLTCNEMLLHYGVGDGRRRICDLKENGVAMSYESDGLKKTWFFSDENKKHNSSLFK